MRTSDCPREPDVLEALRTSAWPDCCTADLTAHVSSCRSCADLVAIVAPLLDEHKVATVEAQVPPSAIVWWRAQVRAREEAARVAARPITIVQGLSLSCGAGLLAAAVGFVSPTFRQWVGSAVDLGAAVATIDLRALSWPEVHLLGPLGVAALAGFTMLAVLTPLAIYLAREE